MASVACLFWVCFMFCRVAVCVMLWVLRFVLGCWWIGNVVVILDALGCLLTGLPIVWVSGWVCDC